MFCVNTLFGIFIFIQYNFIWMNAFPFAGYCNAKKSTLEDMCSTIKSDDTLYSMFRVNSKPIPCPFSGPSFTFSYDKGYGECLSPVSLGEKCIDESKLLLKYQACPDIEKSESSSEFSSISFSLGPAASYSNYFN